MNTRYVFNFPNGHEIHNLDLDYCPSAFRIGEMVFFEGEKEEWRVADIQHQFRRGLAPQGPKQIMVIVILEKAKRRKS